jgi:hypothetical protein
MTFWSLLKNIFGFDFKFPSAKNKPRQSLKHEAFENEPLVQMIWGVMRWSKKKRVVCDSKQNCHLYLQNYLLALPNNASSFFTIFCVFFLNIVHFNFVILSLHSLQTCLFVLYRFYVYSLKFCLLLFGICFIFYFKYWQSLPWNFISLDILLQFQDSNFSKQ